MIQKNPTENPLERLDDWDDDVAQRYPSPGAKLDSDSQDFRDYSETTRDGVRDFYRLNHERQTVDFVKATREKYLPPRARSMGIWDAMDFLNELVDDSDPDIELPQIAHAIQTAEAIRADGHPDWFVLTGLIHDMGKVLCLFDEPQWAVTGDTFPVGCRYSEKIVYHEFFELNPDWKVEEFQTQAGIYDVGCGLDNVLMSWGHDEYLYQVVKDYIPVEAQYMIRFHSFYAGHREGDYDFLMNERDQEMFRWVRKFNRYDLYTKCDTEPDYDALMPFYRQLVDEFFPAKIWW
ncbi:MAG: inositol oxygenase [Planctomycetaceae bacterium]|nr:inositol oxygenase [Planctomycetaceae bacterium]